MKVFFIHLFCLMALCLFGQPNTLGSTNIVYFNNDCNSYSGSWNDPSTTADGIINNSAGGVAMACSLPALFTYNLSSTRDITAFWLETKVGAVVDNGINSFEVRYYDDFNGAGSLLHTQSESASLMDGWQSFNTSVTVANVKSFTFTAITQHGGPGSAEFDEVGLTSTVTLPIELTRFSLHEIEENQVQLEWTTASETNNNYFSLEKSKDGITWVSFDKVDGQGNSNLLVDYQYIDSQPFWGLAYYRLKQVDFDGAYSFSSIKTIDISSSPKQKVIIFPNPAMNSLTIQGIRLDKEIQGIQILDVLGRNFTSKVHFLNVESNSGEIEVVNLPKGIYFIKIKDSISKFYKI